MRLLASTFLQKETYRLGQVTNLPPISNRPHMSLHLSLQVATRLLTTLLLAAGVSMAGQPILLMGDEPGPWKEIFQSVGLSVTQANHIPATTLRAQVEAGAFVVIEGQSDFAWQLGIRPGKKRVSTRSLIDTHNPKLPIIWQKPLDIVEYSLPERARVFARERWNGIPLVAGIRSGSGAVLWLAAHPGERGYERFPYLLQALQDLGLEIPLRSNRLWAFLDPAYRSRADIDYIADRWVRAGITALHVAAWKYMEVGQENDIWLKNVIDACHRRGILVYAWIELPHVSDQFWNDHPEWREKTALLQDAHLDWRKLMNLQNRDCFHAVSAITRDLLKRFDWDGVNLAELYFESLEGFANPARFTPMNDDVRREYRELTDVDPLTLFKTPGDGAMAGFLQYRAEIARRMQEEWMGVLESVRLERPHLDIVLTHVDDRFDTRMREAIGADAGRVLPMLTRHDFTFLIEDPATIWHLGAERYRKIAEAYRPLTTRQDRLAIDLNIVERYQDVYPTKQQTGTELFQLVHTAAAEFPRVALYFETSILKPDLDLLPAAAAAVTQFEQKGGKTVVNSPRGVGLRWTGYANVDGKPWPVTDGVTLWLPPGPHVVETGGPAQPTIRLEHLTADLRSASTTGGQLDFSYSSSSRVYARLSQRPASIQVDGEPFQPQWSGERTLILPRGQHVISVR